MKNFLNKLSRDRFLITAMCACILLITAAGLISVYNKNNSPKENDDFLTENTTQADETKESEIAENTSESEKDLVVIIETNRETLPEASTEIEVEPTVNEVDVQPETEEQTQPPYIIENNNETENQDVASTEAEKVDSLPVELSFSQESKLLWPVSGEIIREFSMDTTVWFSTLKQYQVSEAVQIQSEAGMDVVSPANAQVIAVGSNNEIGGFILLDLGNGFRVELGQLSDIEADPGEYVLAGTVLAKVSSPSYYYSSDGDHVYMKMTMDGTLIDPLDYLQ